MSKILKIKFIVSILIGILLFIYCSFRQEMITIPLEIGIGTIIVMLTAIFVDNINKDDNEFYIEAWQFKIMYSGFLLIVIVFAVIAGDFMKKHL